MAQTLGQARALRLARFAPSPEQVRVLRRSRCRFLVRASELRLLLARRARLPGMHCRPAVLLPSKRSCPQVPPLGWNGAASRIRGAGLAGSFVCLAGALLAGNAFLGVAHAALGASATPKHEQENGGGIVVKPEPALAKERTAQAAKPAPAPTAAPKPQANPDNEPQGASDNKKQSYMDAMAAAGIKITDVDELIALKIQGVTPEYIKGMHDLGL